MKRFLPSLPILQWGRSYNRETLTSDLIAAVIVTIMLIPQSLAYAMLAGLPPQIGLYASITPLIAYAVFGSSRTLAVGPVAVVSLMTAVAVGEVARQGTPEYLGAAIVLALLSGLMLVAMGLLRLGFLANFLSHPVISGFITASGLLIAAGQVKYILGVKAGGHNLPTLLWDLAKQMGAINLPTLCIGVGALAFLWWSRSRLGGTLVKFGMSKRNASLATKVAPVIAVAVTTSLTWWLDLAAHGLKIVGSIPQGLPAPAMPVFDLTLWQSLLGPAALISVIGFVESVSVAQTLAAKRRQRIEPDQELVGLGASNIVSALSGGYPVTGGFARSVVNFDAGAQTPAAGAFTAVGITLAALLLTPTLFFLPHATLAATIIVAVLSLVDFDMLKRTWTYSRADFIAVTATILVTLLVGVEQGVTAGVLLSIVLLLYRTSRPHIAVTGRVPGTEHFRNVERHTVQTCPHLLSLRIDESLYFANARFLEDRVDALVAAQPDVTDVVLQCSAVNEIDASALESLEELNQRLLDAGVRFHLSEVKGPVMDKLQRSDLLQHLGGRVFLSNFEAWQALAPDCMNALKIVAA
jgi:SulP family sulfate permease